MAYHFFRLENPAKEDDPRIGIIAVFSHVKILQLQNVDPWYADLVNFLVPSALPLDLTT